MLHKEIMNGLQSKKEELGLDPQSIMLMKRYLEGEITEDEYVELLKEYKKIKAEMAGETPIRKPELLYG